LQFVAPLHQQAEQQCQGLVRSQVLVQAAWEWLVQQEVKQALEQQVQLVKGWAAL
jgi:hypothetical protein